MASPRLRAWGRAILLAALNLLVYGTTFHWWTWLIAVAQLVAGLCVGAALMSYAVAWWRWGREE